MKSKIFLIVITVLALILPIVLYFFNTEFEDELADSTSDISWYYYDSQNNLVDVTFPIKIKTDINDEFVIYSKITNDTLPIETLSFESISQNVEVRIDDQLIYEYSTNTNKQFGLSIPRKINIVNLQQDVKGKTISIHISSPYHKYSGYIPYVKIGESSSVVNQVYSKYSFRLVLSLVIMFLSLSFIFANFLFYKTKMSSLSLFHIFLTGLFVGVWLLGDSVVISRFINAYFSDFLTYFGLFAFSVIFSIYLKSNVKNRFSGIFLFISLLNLFIQTLLHYTKVVDFILLMPLNLLLILSLFGYYLHLTFKNIRLSLKAKRFKSDFVILIEFILICILFLATLLNIVLQNLTNINMNSIIGIIYFVFLIVIYVKTIIIILRKAESSKMYKAKLRETQNYLMQSQMKPHFIFNTLGAIRTLIMSNPQVAYDMTTNFSKYLRANISTIEPGEKISFSQELEHIKAYAAIEQQRFANRINVIYDVQADNFYLPPLSVEPLVENAIKHGVCKKIKGGTVKITSREYEDRFEVIVEDDGVGFDTSILESSDNTKSVGLKFIILRLKQLSDADFVITSIRGKGTKATITIRK